MRPQRALLRNDVRCLMQWNAHCIAPTYSYSDWHASMQSFVAVAASRSAVDFRHIYVSSSHLSLRGKSAKRILIVPCASVSTIRRIACIIYAWHINLQNVANVWKLFCVVSWGTKNCNFHLRVNIKVFHHTNVYRMMHLRTAAWSRLTENLQETTFDWGFWHKSHISKNFNLIQPFMGLKPLFRRVSGINWKTNQLRWVRR